MEFKIRDDIDIRSLSFKTMKITQYTAEDTARLVSYFLNKINSITDLSKPIGVKFGILSYVATCCMLALIKSGRDYGIIYYKNGTIRESADIHFSHVFKLGPYWETSEGIDSVLEYETEGLAHPITTDLTFEYSEKQKVYALAVESEQLEILMNSGKIEESAVKTAMEHYFHEDDFCAFNRPLRHTGVATLCIYPAMFKAKGIAFCGTRPEWATQIHLANHVHMSYDMMNSKWVLPKKLRMLTTGGYDFNQDFVEYVHSKSEVENIVDCYGTRYCPPPMAIRHLTISDYPAPFKWVNEFIKPRFRNNWLYLVSDDMYMFANIFNDKNKKSWDELITIDTIFAVDEKTFYLVDVPNLHKSDNSENTKKGKTNVIANIRMHHETYSDCDFVDFVYQNTNLSIKLAYHYDEGTYNPKILVNANELDQSIEFVKENEIEAVLYVKYDAPPQ